MLFFVIDVPLIELIIKFILLVATFIASRGTVFKGVSMVKNPKIIIRLKYKLKLTKTKIGPM